jgi:hypothetical protein
MTPALANARRDWWGGGTTRAHRGSRGDLGAAVARTCK